MAPIDSSIDFGTPNDGAPAVDVRPLCAIPHLGPTPAEFLAPQSTDQGRTVTWKWVCDFHARGWWCGADWRGPIFRLVLVA